MRLPCARARFTSLARDFYCVRATAMRLGALYPLAMPCIRATAMRLRTRFFLRARDRLASVRAPLSLHAVCMQCPRHCHSSRDTPFLARDLFLCIWLFYLPGI
jgi:hypothetical protein